MSNTKYLIPAIPPEDYDGSIADWVVALVQRGLFDDSTGGWYGDVMITEEVYNEILKECEA